VLGAAVPVSHMMLWRSAWLKSLSDRVDKVYLELRGVVIISRPCGYGNSRFCLRNRQVSQYGIARRKGGDPDDQFGE